MGVETGLEISDHQRRAARELAQWELGSPHWADWIIGALVHPDETLEYLRREREEEVEAWTS